jgi:hypothetical protein
LPSLTLLVVSVIFLFFAAGDNVSASSSDWTSGQPVLGNVENNVTSVPIGISNNNIGCNQGEITTMVHKKLLGLLKIPFFENTTRHDCLTQTSYGNVSAGGFITTNNSVLSGELYEEGGFKVNSKYPVPNSENLLTSRDGKYRLYENFASQIDTKLYKGVPTQQIKHFLKPDAKFEYIKDASGQPISLRYGLGFSKNGQWLISESSDRGIIVYNLDNHKYKVIDIGFEHSKGFDPKPQLAVSSDGKYAVVASSYSNRFKLFDLDSCTAKSNSIDQCDYVDLWNYLQKNLPGYTGISTIRFADNYTLKLYIGYRDTSNERKVTHTTLSAHGHHPDPYGYLALGDSFASGEGTFDYKPGTDKASPYNKCHLSLKSYPYLIASEIGLNEYESIACSGAVLDDLGEYKGQERIAYDKDPQSKGVDIEDEINRQAILSNFLPGFIPQLQFVKSYQPSTVTVSIFGNDIGFREIVIRCMFLPDQCYKNYENRYNKIQEINQRFPELVNNLNSIKDQSAPNAKIYVLGYPLLAKEDGACALNVRANKEEVLFLNNLVKYLNLVIKKASDQAGVFYVDVENALKEYRLCETDKSLVAVNGLTAGNDELLDIGPLGKESYHPNAWGHKLFAKTILEKTNDFTEPSPIQVSSSSPLPQDSNTLLAGVPYAGGTVYSSFGNITIKQTILEYNAKVTAEGFAAGSSVYLEMQSNPVGLGSFTADNKGVISENIELPRTIEPGFHTIYAYGINGSGQDTMAEKLVYVVYSSEDFDGDGVLNKDEACLVGEPAGVDDDKDGTDDACDGFIDKPPKEEVVQLPGNNNLPGFESFPSDKPPENNPETVAGDEPEPDTISGVNPSTNQAPSNSSALQPNAGQPQNTGGGLQSGGGIQTGGDSSANSLLSQGVVADKPLEVGVASASTESSTAPAQAAQPQQAGNGLWLVFFLFFLALFFALVVAVNKIKAKKSAFSDIGPPAEIISSLDAAAPAVKPKDKKPKKKKKPKKPHHR